MTLEPLSGYERQRLGEELRDFLSALELVGPRSGEVEVAYTARVLLPAFQSWVKGLRRPGLFVRGDGGPGLLPIRLRGVELFPDIEVSIGTTIECAIEVKFLRSNDTSGSITKAVGQASLYGHLKSCFGCALVLDLRDCVESAPMNVAEVLDLSPTVSSWFFSGAIH